MSYLLAYLFGYFFALCLTTGSMLAWCKKHVPKDDIYADGEYSDNIKDFVKISLFSWLLVLAMIVLLPTYFKEPLGFALPDMDKVYKRFWAKLYYRWFRTLGWILLVASIVIYIDNRHRGFIPGLSQVIALVMFVSSILLLVFMVKPGKRVSDRTSLHFDIDFI